MTKTFGGVVPVVPVIFDESEALDLDGYRRTLDYLIDARSDAVCVLANYSEQFSLDDAERDRILDTSVNHIADRVPVVVTTSHFSWRVAAARSLRAQKAGASVVMLMPPFFGATLRAEEAGVVEYFRRVADKLTIDIMIQDAPLSSTPLSASLIATIAKTVPQVRYAKIEVARAADKIRALGSLAPDDLPGLFDGEEAVTLIPDLDAGAVGSMTSALLPDRIGSIVRNFHAGFRGKAVEEWEDILPLIQFENRQCGLAAAKVVLCAGGVIASDRTRGPLTPVSAENARALVELARRKDAFALRWM